VTALPRLVRQQLPENSSKFPGAPGTGFSEGNCFTEAKLIKKAAMSAAK